MRSNFTFLDDQWPDLLAEATQAERNAVGDPRTSCFYARRTLELTVEWLYRAEGGLRPPYKDDLSGRLFEPTFRALVGPAIHAKMDVLRRQGNAAVHRTGDLTPRDSLPVVRELFHVMFWLARRYSREPVADQLFDPDLIPRPVPAEVRAKRQAEIQEMARRLEQQDAELAKREAERADLDSELAALRAEVAAAKAVQAATPDDHDYDEDETRDLFIDLMLGEAGWALEDERDREFQVEGMPNREGVGFVDYVLWGDDGKPLGLVEAKRTRRDPKVGQQQAKLYADCLEQQFGQRPVIFFSNGYTTWLWDDNEHPPREVQGFYTKDELALRVQRRSSRRPLAETAIDNAIVERHYQHRAIRRIGEAFERDRQRDALVVMATGAGKTRTVIALVDQLMRAGWVKRVLFLADRIALVNQAANAFKTHLPDAVTVNLVTEKGTDGRVYVSTYPTMMGLIDQTDEGLRRFGPGFFDLVVIDEAHRSVYQKYQAIFGWFDSYLVGLTATPKDEIDRNTYRLFHLEDGVPTDAYPLSEAVTEGFLVPPRAVSVPLKFQREGIRYDELSEEEKDAWDAAEWTEDGQVPDEISAEALNTFLFNADTIDKVLETLMTQGHRVAGGDRLGKTIVFAKNNAHAHFIEERFNANYPEHRGHFARVITYQTEYAQSLIDDFGTKDKAPHLAISVDMLDTGIDVPEVVNLVFFKPVRSKAKFWQMIGRGTRLCPDLFGPGDDKQDFFVFDVCQNLEYFNTDLAGAEGSLAVPLSQKLFAARVDLLHHLNQREGGVLVEVDGTHSEAGLRADTARQLQAVVAGMTTDNFVVRPHRQWVETYSALESWASLSQHEQHDVVDHLAALPSSERDDDEAAKRFDLAILRLQLGQLRHESGVEAVRRRVQQIAATLLEQLSIPAVKQQEPLLRQVASDEWWVDVTLPSLELVRRRLRSLVALIPRAERRVVYADFEDELGELARVELKAVASGAGFERFKAKARAFLREHEDHLALQKVRRNAQLTDADLAELERMLVDSGVGTPEDLERAATDAQGMGLFIRSLVGLEREAAQQALAGFLSGRTLTGNQVEFIGLVLSGLTENGVLPPVRLYESPFTDVAPEGPEGIFAGDDVDALVVALDRVRDSAVPRVASDIA